MLRAQKNIIKEDYIFLSLILICAVLVFSSFKYLIFHTGADEGYYLKYATTVSENGIKAIPGLFKDYISNQKDWVYPNPLRIAFILISALWVKVFGATYLDLSALSLFSYLLTLGVSYYYARKYFGGTTALLFSVLLGFSPLGMAMARRALVDAPANLFLAASLWLFFDMIEERKKFKPLAFVLCFTTAILMKESSVLLVPVFIFYFLWQKYGLHKKAEASDLLCATIYPAAIATGAYLLAAGSLPNVLNVIKIIILSPATNEYAILYCSGPWMRYIIDFFVISPPVIMLAAAFFVRYFFLRQKDSKIAYFIIAAVIYFIFLNFFAKNIRYAMLLDTPIRLFAALMITEIAGKTCGKYVRLAAYLAVFAIAVYDYASFYKFFIINGIYDPVSILLLKAKGIF